MGKVSGRYAVVTGSAQGIGAAIAKRLYEDGADGVAILDMNLELAKKTAASIDATGTRVIAIRCNVGSKEDVESAFKDVYEKFKRIDILVNNAGIIRDSMFHKMTYEQWDTVINVNLDGMFYCCKQVASKMREQKYGKIVNVSSISAFGNAGQCNYAASKAGIIGFSKSLAKELGRNNCTVNVIVPGYIDTDMFTTIPEKIKAEYIKAIPMQRLGSPDELAAATSFFCCDDSSFVTGTSIVCCGGALT